MSSSSPTSILAGSLPGAGNHKQHHEQDMPPLSLNSSPPSSSACVMMMVSPPPAPPPSPSLSSSWDSPLPVSQKALRTTNPIRAIVDPIVANIQSGQERGDGKDLISLALGDPTAAGNLPPCPVALQAIVDTVTTNSTTTSCRAAAGYVPAIGTLEARQAIAKYHESLATAATTTTSNSSVVLDQPPHLPTTIIDPAHDVIVASGCSGALELALTALLDTDSILLVPQPGFPLYQVIAESHGAKVVPYRLDPDNNWTCDFGHLHALMRQYNTTTTTTTASDGDDANVVRAMVINNPSNPTGAVWTRDQLCRVVQFCHEYHLPLVADEVYGDLTFAGRTFYPAAAVAAQLGCHVPVITASGLGKQFLLPGWRVGWIVFQDNVYGSLRHVQDGAKRLAQVVLGASHLAQTAIPSLLDPSNPAVIQDWKQQLRQTLQDQANFLCNQLATATPGLLQVLPPGGAMYAMVRINTDRFDDTVQNDMDFSKRLLAEENVFVLPGSCFGIENVFRVVFCAPVTILDQAAKRIGQFCERHRNKDWILNIV